MVHQIEEFAENKAAIGSGGQSFDEDQRNCYVLPQ
jgi:hypothetical protein